MNSTPEKDNNFNQNNLNQNNSGPLDANYSFYGGSDIQTSYPNTNPDFESFQSLLVLNQNLRTQIKLGISIYKELKNNFDRNNIHGLLSTKKTENS